MYLLSLCSGRVSFGSTVQEGGVARMRKSFSHSFRIGQLTGTLLLISGDKRCHSAVSNDQKQIQIPPSPPPAPPALRA